MIDYLKEKNYQTSLSKLQHVEWKREHKYSLWQQEKNVLSIFSEAIFIQDEPLIVDVDRIQWRRGAAPRT